MKKSEVFVRLFFQKAAIQVKLQYFQFAFKGLKDIRILFLSFLIISSTVSAQTLIGTNYLAGDVVQKWYRTDYCKYSTPVRINNKLNYCKNGYWVEETFSTVAGRDVNVMEYDKNGNLWCGTTNGLSKFDGQYWQTYNVSNSQLLNDTIISLFVDKSNKIWVGTVKGLSSFDSSIWTTYTTSNSNIGSNYISQILADGDGRILISTANGGMSRLYESNWITYTMSNSRITSDNVYIAVNKKKEIYVSGSRSDIIDPRSLAYLDSSGTWHDVKSYPNGIRWPYTGFIQFDNEDNLFVSVIRDNSSPYNIFKYDGVFWSDFTQLNAVFVGYTIHYTKKLCFDSKNNLWFTKDRNLYKFDGSNISSLSNLRASSFAFYGNTITTESNDGIVKIVNGSSTIIGKAPSIQTNNIYSVASNVANDVVAMTSIDITVIKDGFLNSYQKSYSAYSYLHYRGSVDASGKVWFGSNGKFVNTANPIGEFSLGPACSDFDATKFTAVDKLGNVFAAGTNSGNNSCLKKITNNSLHYITLPTDKYSYNIWPGPKTEITDIAFDIDNNVWLSSLGDGLIMVSSKNYFDTLRLRKSRGEVSNDIIYSLAIDKSNNFWYSTKDGVYKRNAEGTTEEISVLNNEIQGDSISDIKIKKDGTVLVATKTKGIYIKEGNNWDNINTSNSSLLTNTINEISVDTADNIWLATPNGLSKIHYKGFTSSYNPLKSISGTVHQGTGMMTDGVVMAIAKSSGKTRLKQVRNGVFTLDSLERGDYILYALPNPETVANYYPTYYVNKLKLSDAVVLPLYGGVKDVDMYLSSKPLVQTGTSTIQGRFSYVDNNTDDTTVYAKNWFGNSYTPTSSISITENPCKNLPVLLYNSNNELVQATVTDTNGYFGFQNISSGTYKALGQRVNYSTENSGQVVVNQNSVTTASLRLERIVDGIEDEAGLGGADVFAYPNPFKDELLLKDYNGKVSIYDLTGNLYFETMLQNNKKINSSTWPSGFYLLKTGNKVQKLIKQE